MSVSPKTIRKSVSPIQNISSELLSEFRNRHDIDNCEQKIRNIEGTCYFNSVLNAFLLSDGSRLLLYKAIDKYFKALSQTDKMKFLDHMPVCFKIEKSISERNVMDFFKICFLLLVVKKQNIFELQKSGRKTDKQLVRLIMPLVSQFREGGYPFEELLHIFHKLTYIEESELTILNVINTFPIYHKKNVFCLNALKMTTEMILTHIHYDAPVDQCTKFIILKDLKIKNIDLVDLQAKFDKKHKYALDHAVIAFRMYIKNENKGLHAILGTKCNSKKIVYDSRGHDHIKCDWTRKLHNNEGIVKYILSIDDRYSIDDLYYDYVLFIRKDQLSF